MKFLEHRKSIHFTLFPFKVRKNASHYEVRLKYATVAPFFNLIVITWSVQCLIRLHSHMLQNNYAYVETIKTVPDCYWK